MRLAGRVFGWAVLLLFTAITLVPLAWLILSSFKTNAELLQNPFALPAHWSWTNYQTAFQTRPILPFLRNSVFVSAAATLLIVVASLMAAYALLHRFRLERVTFGFLLFGILLPTNALITPIFFLVSKLGLYNSWFGLALVYAGLFFPVGFLVIKTYMDTIPPALLEAARIDGAGFLRIFGQIVVPLTAPGVATAAILLMINTWNELLFASLLTSDTSSQTVQVGIRYFLTTYNANYPLSFAATVIGIAPTVVAYILLSDRIVDAMTAGSVK